MSVEQIINDILVKEGGYVDHPDDAGGPTNFGISLKLLKRYNPNASVADIKNLTKAAAYQIYYDEFYKRTNIYLLSPISDKITSEVLDSAVNLGPAAAINMLQRALNVFNIKQQVYADIVVNGALGKATVASLQAFMAKRGAEGEVVLLKTLNALQAVRYIELAEITPAKESFVYGWIRTRS